MQYQTIDGRTYYHFEEHPGDRRRPPRRDSSGSPVAALERYSRGSELFSEQRFWRRQFGGEVTRMQKRFDWTFGVFLPLICFYFDPVVFRSWFGDAGLLGYFQVFAYALGFLSVLSLAAWLLWREKMRSLGAWLSGVLLAASLVSFALGVVLFPLSTLGFVFLIGVLGYTPLFSSLIYLRNGVRAARGAAPFVEKRLLRHIVVLAGIASVALPWVLNQVVK